MPSSQKQITEIKGEGMIASYLPPHLTHYFRGDLGTLPLRIPYYTCNATTVAR